MLLMMLMFGKQDLSLFYKQYKQIEPYLKQTKGPADPKKENLQTIEDRAKLVSLFIASLI